MTSSSGFSAIADGLVAYCEANPLRGIDARRFLLHLCSGPDAVIDWRSRGVVAVLLDALTGSAGSAPFEIVGLAGGVLDRDLAVDLIGELSARTKAVGAKAVELAMTPVWQPHAEVIAAAGFRHAYRDYDMVCPDPGWGPDATLPERAFWADVVPDWIDAYYAALVSGFAAVPGAFLPSEEEVRRYLAQPNIRARVLIEDGSAIGLLRYSVPDNYINAVVRAGSHSGRGIGRLIMDEARRQCAGDTGAGRPMRLSVVDSNRVAMELYRRCNFVTEREIDVVVRAC